MSTVLRNPSLTVAARNIFDGRNRAASVSERFLIGAGWSMAGAAIGQACLLLASMGIARSLGPERFGVFAFIQNTVNMAANLASAGLGLTAMRYLPKLRRDDPRQAAAVLVLTRRAAAIAGVAGGLLLWWTGSALGHAAGTGGLLLLVTALQSTASGGLLGLEQFSVAAQLNALRGVLGAALSFCGARLHGEAGALLGLLAAACIVLLLNERALRRCCRHFTLPIDSARAVEALPLCWGFSLPSLLASVLAMPVHWGVQALTLPFSGGLEQNALLQAAGSFRNAAAFLPTQVGQAAIPILAGAAGARHRRSALAWATSLTLLTALPAAGMMVLGREWLMSRFGPPFRSHADLLLGTAAAGLFFALALPPSHALAAAGRMWTCFALNLIWAVVLLVLSLRGLAAGRGAAAIVGAYAVAYAIHALLSWIAVSRLPGPEEGA